MLFAFVDSGSGRGGNRRFYLIYNHMSYEMWTYVQRLKIMFKDFQNFAFSYMPASFFHISENYAS